MDNLIDIEWKILEQLNTLKWTDEVFNEVDDVFTMENITFPYVWFELVEQELVQHSTCEDKIEWTFDIYMFQEINDNEWISRRDAKLTVQKWTKQISELLEKNYTLDWEITTSSIINIKYDTFQDEKWVVYYSKISYIVEFYKNIHTL